MTSMILCLLSSNAVAPRSHKHHINDVIMTNQSSHVCPTTYSDPYENAQPRLVEFPQKARVFHRKSCVSPHSERPLHRVCSTRCDQPPTRIPHRRPTPKITGAFTCWGRGIVKSSLVYGRAVVRTRSIDSTTPHFSTVPKVSNNRIIA